MIKKVVVGTAPIKISEGMNPKTLIIYNNSASMIYLISDPLKPITEGIPIPVGNSTGNPYVNYYAKGDYYLVSNSERLDVTVET